MAAVRAALPALLLAVVLLLPAATASSASAPFTLGPQESMTLRLKLDEPAKVMFALRFEVGSARAFTVDGPGSCDLSTTATGMGALGSNGATMAMKRCALPAGTHDFVLHMGVGWARGSLSASHGRWT